MDQLTVSEVAKILRVDDTTVRRWVKQGALEAICLPHVNRRQAYRISGAAWCYWCASGSSPCPVWMLTLRYYARYSPFAWLALRLAQGRLVLHERHRTEELTAVVAVRR